MSVEKIIELFEGNELSDELKSQIVTIFEAVIKDKEIALRESIEAEHEAKVKTINEEKETSITEAVEAKTAEMTEAVDKFMDYAITEWAKTNAVGIESGVKVSIAESFYTGMKTLLKENNVEMTDEAQTIAEELEARVKELETKLDESVDAKIELSKELNTLRKEIIVIEECDELTDSQIEKMQTLVEDVAFTSAEEYASKVRTIKESYFPSKEKVEKINEDTAEETTTVELSESTKRVLSMFR